MIIYYAMTKFHLIFTLTHKLCVHKEEDAILFLYSGLQDLETNYSRLVEKQIFKNVYIVPEILFHKSWKPLNEHSTDKEISYNIEIMLGEIEDWLPTSISAQDRIYIANDHWALGTYCIAKQIPYIYYEDGVGMLSKPEYSYELVKRVNHTHAIIAKHINAFGNNSCVVEKLADLNNQTEGFFDEKAKHFSVKERLKMLDRQGITDLLYVFNAPDCGCVENATILLTEHFVNMKRLTIEGQRELYAMLVDFFSGGETLYIKPHPNDFQISYQDIFPEALLISRKFPSELLPFCFPCRLNLALAACSTSVFGLQDIVKRTLRFDIDIENHYMYIPKYFVVKLVLDLLGQRKVYVKNAYTDILSAFGIFFDTSLKAKPKGRVVVWDKVIEEESTVEISEKDVLICVNSLDNFRMFEHINSLQEMKNWICIRIKKDLNTKNRVTNPNEEYLWIYTKNAEKRNKIKKVKETVNMVNTGMMLDISVIADDNEMKIKLLEGNLRAALDRIERYKVTEAKYVELVKKMEEKSAN